MNYSKKYQHYEKLFRGDCFNFNTILDTCKNNTFYIYKNTSYSYSQFLSECASYYEKLQKIADPHHLIGIKLPNAPKLLAIIFSLWKLKKIPLIINHKISEDELLKLKKHYQFDLVIDETFNDLKYSDQSFDLTVNLKETALICLTSGSSDIPKACKISFKNILFSSLGTNIFYKIEQTDSILLSLPMNHIGGFIIPFRALLANTKFIFTSNSDLAQTITEKLPSIISLVPTQLKSLIALKVFSKDVVKNLKVIIVGGDRCPSELIKYCQKNNIPISLSYGMSETCAQVTATTPFKYHQNKSVYSSGLPLPFRTLSVLNGLITVTGETLFLGYLKQPSQEGPFMTNDMGEIFENNLYIFGRSDDQFISGGENIQPFEIEKIISNFPGISTCKVIPVKNREYGKVGFCFFEETQNVDINKLKISLRDKISNFKIPKYFFRTNNELIQKIKLKTSKDYLIYKAEQLIERGQYNL